MGTKYIIYSCLACGVGLAMLITGLLPEDKLRAVIGDKIKSQPNVRIQLLVCGGFFLFVGLVMLRPILL
jgi:hypothetical protein